jgi:hypothetical protein
MTFDAPQMGIRNSRFLTANYKSGGRFWLFKLIPCLMMRYVDDRGFADRRDCSCLFGHAKKTEVMGKQPGSNIKSGAYRHFTVKTDSECRGILLWLKPDPNAFRSENAIGKQSIGHQGKQCAHTQKTKKNLGHD